MNRRLLKTLSIFFVLIFTLSLAPSCEQINKLTNKEEEIKKVGVILPSGEDPRWVKTKEVFDEHFGKSDIECEVLFAQDSQAAELSFTDVLCDQDMDVLVICPVDPEDAESALSIAKKAGCKVICYDSLIPDTKNVDYFATFSSYDAGIKQGQFLVDKFKDNKDVPLYLYAGRVKDAEARKMFAGAWSVLSKAVKNGQFSVKNCVETKDYLASELDPVNDKDSIVAMMATICVNENVKTAETLAISNLEAAAPEAKGDVAILSPTDEISRILAATFRKDKAIKSLAITGSGAEPESLRHIIDGKQDMTVWCDYRVLAKAAAEAAEALIEDVYVESDTVFNNGTIDVPAILSDETAVDKEALDKLIREGEFNKEEIDKFAPKKSEKKSGKEKKENKTEEKKEG